MKRLLAVVSVLMFIVVVSPLMTAEAENVGLLFVYNPGCPDCAYQIPIIGEFEGAHSALTVIKVKYNNLNEEQKRLIEGSSGHPVMVFYKGDCIRRVVGKTSREELEKEYEEFLGCLGTITGGTTTIEIRKACP